MSNATEEEEDKRRAKLAEKVKFYCSHNIGMPDSVAKEYNDLFMESGNTGTDKPDTTMRERKG